MIAEYLYDTNNRLVTTVGPDGTLVRTGLYADGEHWMDYYGAIGSSNAYTEFRLTDQVGTLNANFDQNGNVIDTCIAGPFGESMACSPSFDYTENHFTDKKRDQESNLDYFGARYYESTLGRFMSPDSLGGHLADPESLNKYAYARDNPLIYIDPDGHDFNLTGCGQTNTTNCQSNMAGTYDSNGKFTATIISNGANGPQDQNGNAYSGTVTSAGVSFSQAGSNTSYGGQWINNTNDVSFAQTGGALNGFSFTFTQPNTATGQTLAGTFSYPDSMSELQAGSALEAAGFSHSYLDAIINPFHGYDVTHYRGGGDPTTGAGAAHFILTDQYIAYDGFAMGPERAGEFHFGETDPRVDPIQHIMHDVLPSFTTPR